jgi:tetratricopeptide (TPR) repeat protein
VEVGSRRGAVTCPSRLVEIAASDEDEGGLMSGYAVARLDEIDEIDDGRCPWRPVRHHFGITSFGVNAWTARDAGDRIINEHDESEPDSNEELYLVLRGRAVFELDGDRVVAPVGTLVYARPGVKRTAFAEEPETTIIALGGTPGKAYEPVGWELWAPLRPLYEAGEYAEVADRLRVLLEADPQYAELFYNLACCESLAGRTTEAVDHLRRAVDMAERFRAYAKDDSDFDPIRVEPAFEELIDR